MRNPISVKQEFLKKWIQGLKAYNGTKKEMSIMERKKAIKLSADVAMASTRNSKTTYWSHALIANASEDDNNKFIVTHILGDDDSERIKKASIMRLAMSQKSFRSKKILKKSCSISRKTKQMAPRIGLARCMARRLVKKRTQVLKTLVPGGEYMDNDMSLIKETLDYILSLRVQVDVMRHLANATDQLSRTKT
ncbi:transcription factor IBH1-like 1 [Nicotiana tomentosiformis]|uniref:transcription factor IBH1-like 1 n=1 Tax=Nicotiana tomentosiformis TaxID=4098 RepID=UPI00051BE1C7|nr:transcription factor IBH1-like 1 [Nicotiana tomentosiformis]